MKLIYKKTGLFFSILSAFYGCAGNSNGSNQSQNNSSTDTNITDTQTTVNFFASGRFRGDSVLSSIMVFPYSKVTGTFSEPYSLQDPFGNISFLDHSYTRKVTCKGNSCIAIGGYNFDPDGPGGTIPRSGDYGGSIFISPDGGMNWTSQSTPFEAGSTGDHFHSSVEDVACVGDKCIVVGLAGERVNSTNHYSDYPQLGYNPHVSVNANDWIVSEGPLSVGTDLCAAGTYGSMDSGYLNRVYCFNSSKCFILGWASSDYYGQRLHGPSFVLRSEDMINWTWDNRLYPSPFLNYPAFSELKDISCLDANHCYAIGKYFYDSHQTDRQTLLLQTSDGGINWSEDENSINSLARVIFLALSNYTYNEYVRYNYGLGISCAPGGTTCLAIVGYKTSSMDQSTADHGLILKGVKNASTGLLEWTVLQTPSNFLNPLFDYGYIAYTGVSCYSDSVCMITGQYLRNQDSSNSSSTTDDARIYDPVARTGKTGFTLSTTNGGLTWTRRSTESIPAYQNSAWSLLTDVSM